MVACPCRTLVVQYMTFTFIMHLIWFWRLEYCFYIYPPPLDVCASNILFWTTDWIICNDHLLHQIYVLNKDNQQGSSRLYNWFSLRCFGPWMNHLPLVWWSTFGSVFFLLVCSVGIVERIYLSTSCLSVFVYYTTFSWHFPLHIFLLWNK